MKRTRTTDPLDGLHHCPICHDLTDCPDVCARCARLRSRPEDWTNHPQGPSS